MMNESLILILCFTAGMILGVLFFGGLWLTVRKSVNAKIPELWIFGSFLLRTSITLVGFYFISGTEWQRLIFCLLGFITARYLVMRATKKWDAKHEILEKEENHGA
ncbi:F1F0 ATPase subunit 2 [Leeuwenhoekiella aestuarii]|uniref:F1F0 ATPase subunit 2 n=2 Tax=Leeuwenhoekiella aestuarii TaxID=2249426 RepID=A0A4Q0NVP9_9FLAO|nr:F1F0 ATPase subunit 2 [Leeuwenhoekiella aestuarii]RXG15147.1 F1F0 ATPase subunit 2 [Leeuwenhoekiella aestuarii]